MRGWPHGWRRSARLKEEMILWMITWLENPGAVSGLGAAAKINVGQLGLAGCRRTDGQHEKAASKDWLPHWVHLQGMPRPPKPLDREALMNYAARGLSARAQSLSELRARLKRRAACEEDVTDVLARLKEAGLLNDRQFAGSFANWRKDNQGLGKTRVMRDLMARRVAPAVAQEAVNAAFEGVDEIAYD